LCAWRCNQALLNYCKTFRYYFVNHIQNIFDLWQWRSPELFMPLCKVWSHCVVWFSSLLETHRQTCTSYTDKSSIMYMIMNTETHLVASENQLHEECAAVSQALCYVGRDSCCRAPACRQCRVLSHLTLRRHQCHPHFCLFGNNHNLLLTVSLHLQWTYHWSAWLPSFFNQLRYPQLHSTINQPTSPWLSTVLHWIWQKSLPRLRARHTRQEMVEPTGNGPASR